MYISQNRNPVSKSIICPLLIIFYFNSCLSGFIKGASFLKYLVIAVFLLFFLMEKNHLVWKRFFRISKALLVCIGFLGVVYVIEFLANKTTFIADPPFFNCIYMAIIIYIYAAYSAPDKYRERKIIFNFWLIDTLISCIFTIIRLESNPQLARYLAAGTTSRQIYLAGIDTRGVVSYGVIYGLLFIIPFLIQKILDEKKKLPSLLILLVFLTTIIKAQFSIAIILALALCLYTLFLRNPENTLSILSFMCILTLIMLLLPSIITWILNHDLFYSETEKRLEEILVFLNGDSLYGTDMASRFTRYSSSIQSIFESVFLGQVFIPTKTEPGGHSEILDSIAKFGIFYTTMLFHYFISVYKDVKKRIHSKYRFSYFVIQLTMLCLSLINTSLWIPIPMILTVIAPFYIMDNTCPPVNSKEKVYENYRN